MRVSLDSFCWLHLQKRSPLHTLDLAPFGRTTKSVHGSTREVIVEWDDERDVNEIHARFPSTPPAKVSIDYWFRNWPYPPPRMPTMEDPVDDLWQGKWLVAQSSQRCHESECVFSFEPLNESENPLSKIRREAAIEVRLKCGWLIRRMRPRSRRCKCSPRASKCRSACAWNWGGAKRNRCGADLSRSSTVF